MISGGDLYHVMTAVVPLYVAMLVAYSSVRWWKIFTAEQCSGINRFVALFAVPLLSFRFISTNDPFSMNLRFVAADTLQKLLSLGCLTLWGAITRRGSLEWTATFFSLCTLPNTLVMGIPLLRGMYGDFSAALMVQIVVLQCILWYTLMLFIFEFRAARLLIADQFPANVGSVAVDSGVLSLDGRAVEAEAQPRGDGRLHVTLRRSTDGCTPRASNLTNAEIYSLQSSRNPTPRGSSFNRAEFCSSFDEEANRPRLHSQMPRRDLSRLVSELKEPASPPNGEGRKDAENLERNEFSFGNRGVADGEDKLEEVNGKAAAGGSGGRNSAQPPTSVMTRLILIMVWRKLIRNPNTYSSLIGVIWALVCYRAVHGAAAKDDSMWEQGGNIRYGAEILSRTSCHGRGLHCRRPPRRSPPRGHCSGGAASGNRPLRLRQGVQRASRHSQHCVSTDCLILFWLRMIEPRFAGWGGIIEDSCLDALAYSH